MVEVRKSDYMRADVVDPLRKREEFAVSLRIKKRKSILESKRKRLPTSLRVKTVAMSELSLDQQMASSDEGQSSSQTKREADLDLIRETSKEITAMLSVEETQLNDQE